jgi:hypothetical protein
LISAWKARSELACQKCRDEKVTLVGGVAPTAVRFARYTALPGTRPPGLWPHQCQCLRRKHKVYPKELWQTQIVTLGSVHGIDTRYQPALYGPVAIRKTEGGATERMFGQQRDEKRASRTRPNYDLFFFEVETWSGIKMLHEMQAAWTQLGEMGSMVVSTPVLPRYKIGDLIRAFRPPNFRCIGRDQWWMPLRYVWDELRTFNLGRL